MAGSSALAQDSAAAPRAQPGQPPIPAIPGVPAARETRPFRPAPASTGLPLAGFTVPGSSGVAASKADRIRPEFQPGNTYRFVVKTELDDGAGGGFSLEHQARYDAKVRTDGKPGVVLNARTERLDLSLSSRGGALSYQSLKPEDQETPLGRHLRARLNRPVELALDPRGRVDGAKEGGGGDAAALMAGVPSFGPEELAQWVTLLAQGYPDKRVGPGDEWSFRGGRVVAGAGLASFDLVYRHTGPAEFEGNTCVAIDFGGTLAGAIPDGGGAPPVEFQASSLRGRIYFDPLDRMVRFAEQEVELRIARPPRDPAATDASTPEAAPPPAISAPDSSAIRERTTLRLLHVVPTP